MKTKRSILSSAVALAGLPMMLALATPASAYDLNVDLDDNDATAETFEIYGTVRLSLDYGDSDLEDESQEDPTVGLTDGSFGVSSNTTVLGLKGSYNFQDAPFTAIWQMEQAFRPDTGAGDTFTARDTFLGVKTGAGLFRAGIIDTPFKVMGLRNTMYVTTAGDPYAILGKSSISGARLDLRAKNSLAWNGEFAGVKLAAQYGADQESIRYPQPDASVITGSPNFIDDNDGDMYSLSAGYEVAGFNLSAAWVDYSEIYGGGIEAWRVGAKYDAGPVKVGVIYGDIDTDDGVVGGSLNRSEYGAYAQYAVLPTTLVGFQWMHANESDYADLIGADDSADQFTVGVYQVVFPRLLVHAVATTTLNEDGGRYGSADYAHGDRVATVAGGEPTVFSVGAQYSF
jgi:predicted porin